MNTSSSLSTDIRNPLKDPIELIRELEESLIQKTLEVEEVKFENCSLVQRFEVEINQKNQMIENLQEILSSQKNTKHSLEHPNKHFAPEKHPTNYRKVDTSSNVLYSPMESAKNVLSANRLSLNSETNEDTLIRESSKHPSLFDFCAFNKENPMSTKHTGNMDEKLMALIQMLTEEEQMKNETVELYVAEKKKGQDLRDKIEELKCSLVNIENEKLSLISELEKTYFEISELKNKLSYEENRTWERESKISKLSFQNSQIESIEQTNSILESKNKELFHEVLDLKRQLESMRIQHEDTQRQFSLSIEMIEQENERLRNQIREQETKVLTRQISEEEVLALVNERLQKELRVNEDKTETFDNSMSQNQNEFLKKRLSVNFMSEFSRTNLETLNIEELQNLNYLASQRSSIGTMDPINIMPTVLSCRNELSNSTLPENPSLLSTLNETDQNNTVISEIKNDILTCNEDTNQVSEENRFLKLEIESLKQTIELIKNENESQKEVFEKILRECLNTKAKMSKAIFDSDELHITHYKTIMKLKKQIVLLEQQLSECNSL